MDYLTVFFLCVVVGLCGIQIQLLKVNLLAERRHGQLGHLVALRPDSNESLSIDDICTYTIEHFQGLRFLLSRQPHSNALLKQLRERVESVHHDDQNLFKYDTCISIWSPRPFDTWIQDAIQWAAITNDLPVLQHVDVAALAKALKPRYLMVSPEVGDILDERLDTYRWEEEPAVPDESVHYPSQQIPSWSSLQEDDDEKKGGKIRGKNDQDKDL